MVHKFKSALLQKLYFEDTGCQFKSQSRFFITISITLFPLLRIFSYDKSIGLR